MKKIARLALLIGILTSSMISCNKPEAEPPKKTGVNVLAPYRMPSSILMSDEERTLVEGIFDEFDSTRP